MANIMITKSCNLRCTYCFANEFVDYTTCNEEMSIDNFKEALDFATRTETHIGLIGGEPLSHKNISEILNIIIDDSRIQSCTIFTNGILLHKIMTQLLHPKFSVLINYNDTTILSDAKRNRILKTLDEIHFTYKQGHKVTLGINMYKPDFEYAHVIDACKRYGKDIVRTSVCVPNSEEHKNSLSLDWFRLMKKSVIKFFSDAITEGIVPNYDCNIMPGCVLDEDELKWVNAVQALANKNDIYTNIASNCSNCTPVLDILPDLTVVRCFGLSEDLKLSIRDFNNLGEVDSYFRNRIDSFKHLVTSNPECKDCISHKTQQCTGGCISYKLQKIQKARELVDSVEEL